MPAISHAILNDRSKKYDPKKPKINLKGLAIGNGLIDPINQLNYGDYFYQLGLVDSNGRKMLKQYEHKIVDCIKLKDFECAYFKNDELINGIFTPKTLFTNLTGFTNYFNYLIAKAEEFSFFDEFMQTQKTRRAIHVGNTTFTDTSAGTVSDFPRLGFMHKISMDTIAPWLAELLSHYPVFLYYGQVDLLCAYPLGENIIKNLNFTGADEYKAANRTTWHVGNDVAGYAKKGGNLTTILVRRV